MAAVDPVDPRLLQFARSLRRHATDAERLLWMLVRRKGLTGFKFRRQHPLGPYILDFYCARARLAIELDGSQHGTDVQQRHDRRRSTFISAQGVHELRFTNVEVLLDTEGVLTAVWQALHRPQGPSPQPPPASGRGSRMRAPADLA